MRINLRQTVFDKIKSRYHISSKEQKKIILDEFCDNYEYNRKYAIRILNDDPAERPAKKPGRKRKYYILELVKILKKIWISTNRICSKRLARALKIWVPKYSEYFKTDIPNDITKLLFSISPATIDRVLGKPRREFNKRHFCTTKPGSIIKSQIPIKTNQWDESKPGFLESDTVAHCGEYLGGIFIYTINFVDIKTQWTIQRAVMGKGSTGVLNAIKNIIDTLPFKVLGFDCDNGSEFLNYVIVRFFKKIKHIQFTRAREYCKNDNAHIEEKNWSIVREYIGYGRLDTPLALQKLNDLYENEFYLLLNFFIPNFKLIEKTRVGSKIIKVHDKPLVPYQRMLQSEFIPKQTKKSLTKLFDSLNPFQLFEVVKKKISEIQKLAKP